MTPPDMGLPAARILQAVQQAGLKPLPEGAAEGFSLYYDLLARWNRRLNLTAIRGAEEVLERHFLECIFCAQHLPAEVRTLLDYGSGAGFPGIPIALCRPEIAVTLSESQGKKASFLREAIRSLKLQSEVFAGRVETMTPHRQFDGVALRAVDNMDKAILGAAARVSDGGYLIVLTTTGAIRLPVNFMTSDRRIPGTGRGLMVLARRESSDARL